MDGTFGGGDLISASLAIMLGDGEESELHDKSVTLSTSDVTGSQTAVFEYDPADEPVSGTPPGPWDGYSLFTIDLSAVKDDIVALQATVAAIIAILQAHDPDYDPDETPPEDGVQDVVDEEEKLEQCRDAVIAKIQEYFPSFDPQTCKDLVDKIEEDEDAREDAEEHEGYEFPPGTDPNKIQEMVGQQDIVTDTDTGVQIRLRHAIIADDTTTIIAEVDFFALTRAADYQGGRYNSYWLEYKDATHPQWTYFAPGYEGGSSAPMWSQGYYTRVDSATIDYQTGMVTWLISSGVTSMSQSTYYRQSNAFIGYGDTSHVYKVKNS